MNRPTLSSSDVQEAAQTLHRAEKTRKQTRHLSLRYPGMTVEDAYAVQSAWMDIKRAEGRVVKGHKVGLTSRAMQLSAGIEEPDYGALLDDMFVEDGDSIYMDRLIVPRVEVELAFLLKRPLSGPGCTIFDVYNATEFVMPAFEILDARVHHVDPETNRGRLVVDTISDNAGNAALVLGKRPIRPEQVDLRWISALCYRNGRIEETGVAAGVLNHPAAGIAWLANKLGPHGVTLEAGEIVLAGSFIRPVDAAAGDVFHADFGVNGSVTCRFE